jgi:hypothetical protein
MVRIWVWRSEVDLFDNPFEGNFSDLQALRMAIIGTWPLGERTRGEPKKDGNFV